MKGATGGQESGSIGCGTGKLDGGLDSFASGGGEIDLVEAAAGPGAELLGEFTGSSSYVTLQHGWAASVEFGVERIDDLRVVVAEVVNAVSGEEVEDGTAVGGAQRFSAALDVVGIHFEQVKQADPLRIDVLQIGNLAGRAVRDSAFTAHAEGVLILRICSKVCLYIAEELRTRHRLPPISILPFRRGAGEGGERT